MKTVCRCALRPVPCTQMCRQCLLRPTPRCAGRSSTSGTVQRATLISAAWSESVGFSPQQSRTALGYPHSLVFLQGQATLLPTQPEAPNPMNNLPCLLPWMLLPLLLLGLNLLHSAFDLGDPVFPSFSSPRIPGSLLKELSALGLLPRWVPCTCCAALRLSKGS